MFILNFCLDVGDSFKTWTGQKLPSGTSPQKALTILRQIGNDMTSMNNLVHGLNISYNLGMEFKEIYKRLNWSGFSNPTQEILSTFEYSFQNRVFKFDKEELMVI